MKADASYIHLIQQIDELVALFEQHPDTVTRERAITLLGGLDALHREGLRRLVDRVRDVGGEALVDRLAADPVVEILLGLYDLTDLGLPDEPPAGRPSGFVPLDEVMLLQDPNGQAGSEGRADDADA